MSDTVTIHNGHCSYHGPADKAPVWAARAASTDHKISPAPTRSPMNSIAPVPTQTVSADAVPAPLTSFEDTTHAWEEGYRAGRAAGLCWNRTADGTPRKPGLRDYEQVECLIMLPNGNIEIALWNCEHLVWDDEHGDDYRHDAGYPTHWIALAPLRTAVALRALEGKA